MALFDGWRRTLKALKWGKILGTEVSSQQWVSNLEKGRDPQGRALSELLAFCATDARCIGMLRKHALNADALDILYQVLIAAGGGQWAGAHFVPVSTLVFPRLLDHALTAQRTMSHVQLAHEMVQRVAVGRFE